MKFGRTFFLMFSRFEKGIKDISCSKFIDLSELIRIIRNNPNTEKIETIRNLRKNGDDYYKSLKAELPYITPNCMVKIRNLDAEHFDENFMQFSQYLYYDIDKLNPEEYKNYFINRYGKLASMVCLSSSGGGISVLFKVKNTITKENFDNIWNTIRNTTLSEELVDMKCREIGRAMFISHDPELYCNFENEIEIELQEIVVVSDKKRVKQCKTCKDFIYTLNSPFSVVTIGEVQAKLITRTVVDVSNPIVDFKPVDYVRIFIPEHIKDGNKHSTYASMIHALVYLNPTIEEKYIFSFLFYVNSRFARPRMEKREFVRFFNCIYNGIKKTSKINVNKELKFIHFHPDCNIAKEEKINISNMLNGCKRKNESIQKIIDARIELERLGQKITKKNIAETSGLSPKTVRAHLNSPLIDMDETVAMVNNSVSIIPFSDNIVQ